MYTYCFLLLQIDESALGHSICWLWLLSIAWLCFFLANLCYRECEVFSKNHAAPFSKVITFHKREPFDLEAFYSNPQELPYSDHRIGNGANSALLASKWSVLPWFYIDIACMHVSGSFNQLHKDAERGG